MATINGTNQSETIVGTDGDDEIFAKGGNDTVRGGEGNDSIDGGSGKDVLFGNRGDDVIEGDKGSDTLIGGLGDDTLLGGSGKDHLVGGAGDDLQVGGKGSDSFYVTGGNDTIYGNEIGSGGSGGKDKIYVVGPVQITLSDGTVINAGAGEDFDLKKDYGSEDGTIKLPDGSIVTFDDIEDICVLGDWPPDIGGLLPPGILCFTPGTLIATRFGDVPVENLRIGDQVITCDNGFQPVRWVGQRKLSKWELAANPSFLPVVIPAGALGKDKPNIDMMVSPQHKMLVQSGTLVTMFDQDEVLVPAKHLVGQNGIQFVDVKTVTYVHILFDTHQLILADGTWSESFQPGAMSLEAVDADQRKELYALFPELQNDEGRESYHACRPVLKAAESKLANSILRL